MAKRAAPDEQPYRPLLDASLVSSTLNNLNPASSFPTTKVPENTAQKIVEITRNEPPRRTEQLRPVESQARPIEPIRERVEPLVDKLDQEKRILFTRAETQALNRFVNSLADRLNTQIKSSHFIRALVSLSLHAESEIDRRAGEAEPLTRPPNGDANALQRFETEIAKIIAAGLRDAGPVR